jgi:hypothetical protein
MDPGRLLAAQTAPRRLVGEPVPPLPAGSGWRPTQDGITLFNPATVTHYRHRGNTIPTPWPTVTSTAHAPTA